MSMSSAQVLMRRGKRTTANYIRGECARGSNRMLEEVVDIVLHPSKPIDEWESIEWSKWIIAGGSTPDEFCSAVHNYDDGKTCGLVWTANFVAYRCRTCGISPCMSLCADCFNQGNHEGHDYNMFRSQAGGACDCGDSSVMKAEGFCSSHGPREYTANRGQVPGDMICVAAAMMPKLILRLIQHLRQHSEARSKDEMQTAIRQADSFLAMLHDYSTMGAAMRQVMANALTNESVYQELQDYESADGVRHNAEFMREYLRESNRVYQAAIHSLPCPETPEEYRDCPSLQSTLVHKSFLEELVFWTVKFEFPQKIVCLMLNLLTEANYKERLTRAFVLHYSRIAVMLETSTDPDALSNRVVHVSVQLFSNESLAMQMTECHHLLHIMVISLKYMMKKILTKNTLHDPDQNMHMVIDCEDRVMKEHCYWPLVSDLNNVLSHRGVALRFMSDETLLNMWFDFLSLFQGMNVNKRELETHVEYEPNTYYAAFSAELEASAYPMWSLVTHLNDPALLPYTQRVLKSCLTALQDWFDALNLSVDSEIDSLKVSFHLPLHRYLAVFMCQAVKQHMPLREIVPSPNTLQLIMTHLLRIQVTYYEIMHGRWVRNGVQIRGQSMTYIQCNFCNSMVDADLYLLQICATQLPPSTFIRATLNNFGVQDWLSISPYNANNIFSLRQGEEMLESFLTFLGILICVRTNLGHSDMTLTQLEMVTLLCMGDKTHSQLLDLLPERCSVYQGRDFDSELEQVALFKEPSADINGVMQQGIYSPLPIVWEKSYDPIHILLRAVHKKDFQASMDRYMDFVRLKYPTMKDIWPPYRLPAPVGDAYVDPRIILQDKTMHAVLFAVLLRALKADNIHEHILALAIFFLEMAVDMAQPQDSSKEICQNFNPRTRRIIDLDFENWFDTNWLSANLRTRFDSIYLPEESTEIAMSEPQDYEMLALDNIASDQTGPGDSGSNFQISRIPTVFTGYGTSMVGNELVPVSSVMVAPPSFPRPGMRALEAPMSNQSQLEMMTVEHVDTPSSSSSSSSSSSGENEEARELEGGSSVKYNAVHVGETIISTLLKLHSRLSGVVDSFDPNDLPAAGGDQSHPANEGRIGGGPFFIAKLLHKIMKLDDYCRDLILQCKMELWPPHNEEHEAREARKREERRQRARERQAKAMAEMINKQRSFMENATETEGATSDSTENNEASKLFQCAICNEYSKSTEECPVGMVTLAQATAVVGHRQRNPTPNRLPLSDQELLDFGSYAESTFGSDSELRINLLKREFDKSWHTAENLIWHTGVYMITCGHIIHLNCLTNYLAVSPPNPACDKGEYQCPCCRQLANCVLPLAAEQADNYPVARARLTCAMSIAAEISTMLQNNPPVLGPPNPMRDAMNRAVEDMARTTDGLFKYYGQANESSPQILLQLVSSILRTNLEVEITQLGGTFCIKEKSASVLASTRSCLVDLLHVLGVHAKPLATQPVWPTWQQLVGIVNPPTNQAVARPTETQVPLLLKDPSALLTQFILLLPMRLELSHFTCVIKSLYNLMYFECLLQVVTSLSEASRSQLLAQSIHGQFDLSTLEGCTSLVTAALTRGLLLMDDSELGASARVFNAAEVEAEVQALCLPFLRLATLLRHHLYGNALPQVSTENCEFIQLVYFLELVANGMEINRFNAAVALNWINNTASSSSSSPELHILQPVAIVSGWCDEVLSMTARSQVATRDLVRHHQRWHQPRLLKLPHTYNQLFQFYHKRPCSKCHLVPHEASVCLLCGAIVCLKENCCKLQNTCEAVQHSLKCGAGTGIFLVVTSAYIIVIRGRRACIWGSVYLDGFGEEDRDLKRGKPLFLRKERYNLLEQQWLQHKFDHAHKKWVWHREQL